MLKQFSLSELALEASRPLVALDEHDGRISDGLKRTLDISVSLGLIAALLPLMALIALAIRCTSRGPAVYSQRRLTVGGRLFTMYKFRTMTLTAESGTGAVMCSENDPRITRLGRLLRRTRLDELPQLLNVILGDMSLIGPRPERPEIAAQLEHELPLMKRRLEVKAGLSGLAQVTSGYADSAESYREKLLLDLAYIDQRSLALDLRIAVRTLWVILSGFGAR
ncbi:MAG: sugar transferase [Bdellovibrionales bacterium]|nr:sugar transferase [Bdellovibrionales bacterium]